jgi:hypothetical protein
MCTLHRVRWTITPRFSPRPWIACSGCGTHKPFQSSGKIRLNANGKKLDAWLIYRCLSCEKTWNRPLFERRLVRDIDPQVRDALHCNDPYWVRMQEFDVEALRRRTQQVTEFAEVDISRETIAGYEACAERLEIELAVLMPTSLRLDRLLTVELRRSRTQLNHLYAEGSLKIAPERKDALRRRVRDGMRISFDRGIGLLPSPR